MNKGLQALRSVPIRETVADTLRRALLERHFRAGESLSEVDLAEQLTVSRGPVREGLLILAKEGLVVHSHNRGFSVLELTDVDIDEIWQVRIPLESLALALAKKNASPHDLDDLQQLKNKMVEAHREGDFARTVHSDLEFHMAIWEKSGNKWLVAALKRLMVPYFTFTEVYGKQSPGSTEAHLVDFHEMYLKYLGGASSQSAEECVRGHVAARPVEMTAVDSGPRPA